MSDISDKNRKVFHIVTVLAAAIAASAITAVICLSSVRSSLTGKVSEAADVIKNHFYYYEDRVGSEEAMSDSAVRGMVSDLEDPYAAYYTTEEYDAYLESVSGEYKGLGIVIYLKDELPAISRVYSGSTGEAAGFMAGDTIIIVNGQTTEGLTLDAVVALFYDDDPNTIVVSRNGEEVTFTASKGEVNVPYAELSFPKDDTGYLVISGFSGNVVSETTEAVRELNDRGVTKLIIDLRDDPGGSLDKILAIADLFLEKGMPITSIRSADGQEKTYSASTDPSFQGKIVILVNGNTASAAELFCGCMRDNGLAAVVGTQTYGKGIVQTTYKLSGDNGYLKLTTDAYYLPCGDCVQGTGITPDYVLEQSEAYEGYSIELIPQDEDVQFQKAMELVSADN